MLFTLPLFLKKRISYYVGLGSHPLHEKKKPMHPAVYGSVQQCIDIHLIIDTISFPYIGAIVQKELS